MYVSTFLMIEFWSIEVNSFICSQTEDIIVQTGSFWLAVKVIYLNDW